MRECAVVIFTLMFLHATISKPVQHNKDCDLHASEISLSLNPARLISRNTSMESRFIIQLQVKWQKLQKIKKGDWIGIWRSDPSKSARKPLKKINIINPDGSYFLRIRPSTLKTEYLLNKNISKIPKCYWFWIGYVRKNNKILMTSCLKTNPVWMKKLSKSIHKKNLKTILLPGVSQTNKRISLHIVTPYFDLINGARYLKILSNTSTYNNSTKVLTIWNGHEMLLLDFLYDIHIFLNQTHEIVILDIIISNDDTFIKNEIENLVFSLFSDILITREINLDTRIHKLWELNKRLLVSCSAIHNSKYIWNEIESVSYSNSATESITSNMLLKDIIWTLDFESTQKEQTYFSIELDRKIRDDFSSNLLAKLWKEANIVSVSCIICSGIVDIVLKANTRKNICKYKRKRIKNLMKSKWKNSKSKYFTYNEEFEENSLESSNIKIWPTLKANPEVNENYQQTFRLIQINWIAKTIQPNDYVAIFENLPTKNSVIVFPLNVIKMTKSGSTQYKIPFSSPIMNNSSVISDQPSSFSNVDPYKGAIEPLFISQPYSSEGLITTNIRHGRPSLTQLARGGCIGHWVVYLREMIAVAARCISSHPKWVWDNRYLLSQYSLRSLAIPGTHNSGTYSTHNNVNVINKWIVCQDEKILNQLLHGIRYLDLRVGYYPDTEEMLWINHDMVRWLPLHDVLNDIKAFTSLSPDPVIVDVHRTPVGFEEMEASWLLVSLINSTLGDHLAPYSLGWNVTSRDLWEEGKTIIFSFGEWWIRDKVPWLWPPILQAWANAQILEDLKNFMDKEMKNNKGIEDIWAVMGHLTPSPWDFIFNDEGGVRGMSDKVGRPLTDWLSSLWYNNANIVVTDFFHSNNVIEVSIRINQKKKTTTNVKSKNSSLTP